MIEVHARDLNKLAMAAGNECKYSIVVDDGVLKQWVAIGWIDLRPAVPSDSEKYPMVIRGERP